MINNNLSDFTFHLPWFVIIGWNPSNIAAFRTWLQTFCISELCEICLERNFYAFSKSSICSVKTKIFSLINLQARNHQFSGEDNFMCDICCGTFRISELEKHFRSHRMKPATETFICKHCDDQRRPSFDSLTQLERHVVRCHGVKCFVCKQFFASQWAADRHLKSAHNDWAVMNVTLERHSSKAKQQRTSH